MIDPDDDALRGWHVDRGSWTRRCMGERNRGVLQREMMQVGVDANASHSD